MDLAELKFVVDTKELETAATRISELGTAVSKLNKPMQDLTKESAKTNKELSKAEEAAAKAALAQVKLEQAQTKSTQAAAKSSSVLERQNLILEYMAQGNSKGQASILATAKAAGALDDEMLELNKTLVTQRTLIGGDPFDKSIGLMQKLQNEYKTTTEVTNLFNKNLGLTEKQMIDLAREKERLIALYSLEGKSLDNLTAEYDQLIQKSAMINNANDARTNSMKAQIKAQDDTARANAYLASELDRVNRLTEAGGNITIATNNKLIKFEQALKQSGQTAAQQVVSLEKYKASLLSIQKAGGDRQVDYLSRALGPQITDIFVGLYSGQSPMTVLVQQGGQLRDQFALAGVEGAKMGEMLIKSASSMITSIKDVGMAIGQVFVKALAGTGNAIVNGIIAPFKRLSEVREAQKKLDEGLISTLRYTRLLEVSKGRMIQSLLSMAKVAGGVALIAVGLLAKGLFDVIKQEDALTKQLVLTGASLGINTAQATSYANSMNAVGISTDSALKVISAMAKEGGFLASEIRMVVTAADNLKLAGVTIEDTVKQFSKLKEKPVEALIEIARATGLVKPEIIALISELELQGKTSQAAALAMKAYADVTVAQKDRLENELSGFAVFMKTLGTEISNFFDGAFRSLWRKADPSEAIEKQIKQINDVLKGGVFVGGVSESALKKQRDALVEELMRLDDLKVAELSRNNDNIRTAKALGEWQKLSIMNLDGQKKAELDIANIRKVGLQAKKSEAEIEKLIAAYREKNKPAKTPPPPKIDDGFAAALEAANKFYQGQIGAVENLTKSEIALNKVREDAKYKAFSPEQKKQVDTLYEQAAANERLVIAEKDRTNQMDAIAALMGKSDGFGKQYYDTLNLLDQAYTDGNISLEKHIELVNRLYHTTPQVKARQDAIEKLMQAQKKADDAVAESWKVMEELNKQVLDQTELLALEGSLIGSTDAERKKALAIKRLDLQLEKELYEIKNRKIPQSEKDDQENQARQRRLAGEKNINSEIANDFVQKQLAEYNRISDGLTDAVMTGLIEGGKAGRKKLRDLIVAELMKPIRIVIDAVINATLGSFINSLIGGAAGGAAGSSFAGGAAGGGIIGGAALGAQAGAFGQGVASGFSFGAPVSSLGAPTSGAFNMGATYGAPVLGAAAGIYGGRAVSGGYSAMGSGSGNSAVNTGTAIGAAIESIIPGIGTAIGAALGGLAGGAVNRLFGRKLTDVGIRGTLGGETGFEGERYTFSKGGLFRRSKTTTSVLEEADRSAIASDFRLIKNSVMDLAETAGFGSDAIKDFTTSFQINLKGLSPEDAIKKYQEEFAKIEEAMAKSVIGTSGYRRENETNLQALVRLSSFMGGINDAFKKLGFETYKLELGSLDAAQAFIDLFGGIDGFNKTMTFFYDNFFSEEEKLANLTTDLTNSFGKLGEELPSTREEFKQMVIAAQKAGDTALVKNLTDLQYAFADLVPATESITDSVDNLTDSALKYARSLIEEQRIAAGAGAYTSSDFYTPFATFDYSNSDLYSPALSSPIMMGSVNAMTSNTSLINAVNAVQEEIAELRYEVQADVIHNAKTATILTRVVPDGQSLNVTAAIDGGVV
jgi:phage-related minor tail protein